MTSDALGSAHDRMKIFFCDNTDPDGIDRTVARLGDGLGRTLAIVISKSGGTQETRNGALEFAEAYRRAGLTFARAAVAVTMDGSALDRKAQSEGWIATVRRYGLWRRRPAASAQATVQA